jgi:hypothetical protein
MNWPSMREPPKEKLLPLLLGIATPSAWTVLPSL